MVEIFQPGGLPWDYRSHGNHPQIQIHQVTTRPPRRVPGPGGDGVEAMGIEKTGGKKMGKPWRKSMKINDFIKSHWWWSNILEKRYENIGISLDHCAVRFNQQLDHWDILILVALDLRVQSPCEATTKGQTDKAGIGNGMEIACQLAMWKIAFYSPDRNLSMNHTDSYRSYQY